ncbi:MAG: c-type cytochrome [Nitrosomonadales bacterium]|nr:c-type cytochrome [Nitrosomonadales bacterium]
MKNYKLIATVLLGLVLAPTAAAQQFEKQAYDKACASCHNTGVGGAPKLGDPNDWRAPVAAGMARLYKSALEGTPKGMPAKGGIEGRNFTNSEIQAVVDFMVDKVKVALDATAGAAPGAAPAGAAAQALPPVAYNFNRLLKPMDKRNLPPAQDGIHDPLNDGTLMLQPPLQGMADLVRSRFGNNTDWVASLLGKKVTPRWERDNPFAEGMVMDLDILRVPKAAVQDVLFPHKQHTEWLDCSNCHPAIFVPQKGANIISMPLILLGQKCGVCHGTVAFPVSECAKCHSQKKAAAAAAPQAAGKP